MRPDEIKKALGDPNTRAVAVTLTPEMKERLERVTIEIMGELRKRTKGPGEAYMVLTELVSSFEETYGFKGGFLDAEADDKP